VLHYPIYQRLFGDQVLSSRERLQISSVTVVFTDIAGSTRMYEEIGDPLAYNLVRDHFEIIQRVFESHGARLLKTIGDAVMASFLSNRDALRAADEAHHQLDDYNQHVPVEHQIRLRFGMHRGPAILVNLNGQMDYFGRTVNPAARVQSVARSDELSVSEEVYQDPDFQAECRSSAWSDFRKSVEDLKGISGRHRVYTTQRQSKNSERNRINLSASDQPYRSATVWYVLCRRRAGTNPAAHFPDRGAETAFVSPTRSRQDNSRVCLPI
jgi:class 3 adenylate cyclase